MNPDEVRDANFEGPPGSTCEHRTVGPHRAWCLTCGEWCYPDNYCVRDREAFELIHVAWRNERSGALHARKFGFERDGGPSRTWVKLYAYRGDIEAARRQAGKRSIS